MNSTVISLKSAIISEWKYEQTASGTHIQLRCSHKLIFRITLIN